MDEGQHSSRLFSVSIPVYYLCLCPFHLFHTSKRNREARGGGGRTLAWKVHRLNERVTPDSTSGRCLLPFPILRLTRRIHLNSGVHETCYYNVLLPSINAFPAHATHNARVGNDSTDSEFWFQFLSQSTDTETSEASSPSKISRRLDAIIADVGRSY